MYRLTRKAGWLHVHPGTVQTTDSTHGFAIYLHLRVEVNGES